MPVITRFPGGGITKCKQITNFTVIVGLSVKGQVELTWKNPSDDKLKGIEIFYKEGSEVTKHGDGVKCFDSNDASVPETARVNGLEEKKTYYFRAFAYTYKNATRIYNETKEGASGSGEPYRDQGKVVFTSSTTWTVPDKVTSIDVFLVGAGGGAIQRIVDAWDLSTAGAGGAGYTKTIKGIAVTPGEKHNIVIGAGVAGGNGGATNFGSYSVNGGKASKANSDRYVIPGDGGSGGAFGGSFSDSSRKYNGLRPFDGGTGGSDGKSVVDHVSAEHKLKSKGQGTTTREFGDPAGTLYAGGGGGAGEGTTSWGHMSDPKPGAGGAGGGGNGGRTLGYGSNDPKNSLGQNGSPNTGGGAGEPVLYYDGHNHQSNTKGGSGVCIVRWGY